MSICDSATATSTFLQFSLSLKMYLLTHRIPHRNRHLIEVNEATAFAQHRDKSPTGARQARADRKVSAPESRGRENSTIKMLEDEILGNSSYCTSPALPSAQPGGGGGSEFEAVCRVWASLTSFDPAMALSQFCWSTTVKLALPLLVVMAFAAAPSISGAAQLEHDDLFELAEAAPLAKARRGRFLSSFDEVTPVSARRHLNPINLCGLGTTDQCKQIFPFMKIPKCCVDTSGNSACYDIGILFNKCGSCTKECAFGQSCCNGVCSNLLSDPKNCNSCGRVCDGVPCVRGLCGYNGKPF